jgi:hypothetical protein
LKNPGNNFNITADTTKACTSYGFDLCILSYEELLQFDEYVYFAIDCYEICDSEFRVQYTEEVESQLGEDFTYFMTNSETAIIKFIIPTDDPDNPFKHLFFNFNILNVYELKKSPKFLLKKGKAPSSDDPDDLTPMTNWASGKSFSIEKTDNWFCTGCTIYVSITAEEAAIFDISSYGYS